MLEILIGIFILIGGFYLAFVFYQRRMLKLANDVYENRKNLTKIPLDDEFELAKKINLSGESQKKYVELSNQYDEYKNELLPKIDEKINLVKEDGKGINFIKTKKDWHSANQAIETADNSLKEIQAGLVKIYDLNKQHHLAIDELEDKYKNIREKMLDLNVEFGPSTDALEKRLAEIEKTFDKFAELTKQGDPSSAQDVLVDLNSSTYQLESYIQDIPEINQLLNQDFKQQISEIKEVYSGLIDQGYNFDDDDFEAQFKRLSDMIDTSLEKVKNIEIGESKKINADISEIIDGLYDRLELEIKAKQEVDSNLELINEYIYHVSRQNNDLGAKLQRFNMSYILKNAEIERNRQFRQQIDRVQNEFRKDKEQITTATAVYSKIAENQSITIANLRQIESEQQELFNAVVDLPKNEERIKRTLQQIDLRIRTIRRKIDNLNLPGLPEDYAIQYQGVIKSINELNDEMNQPKISVEDIFKQLIIVESDMDDLIQVTETLFDNAILAEQMIQYANRYINNEPYIDKASREAKHYFETEHNYQKSLAIIADAIDKKQRGASAEIKDAYFADKVPVVEPINAVNNEPEE